MVPSGLVVPAATFVVALAVLLVASDAFVSAAERLGLAAGASPFIIGATVVAGGTSLPGVGAAALAGRAGAVSFFHLAPAAAPFVR